MNKQELYSHFLKQQEDALARMTNAAENAIQDVANSPGRMETRYDSSRTENGYLADGINLARMRIQDGLAQLTVFDFPQQPQRIVEGALVKLKIEDTQISTGYYFILPYGGGKRVQENGEEVMIITPEAPIFKAMYNRRVGDTFAIPGKQRKYTVLEIE